MVTDENENQKLPIAYRKYSHSTNYVENQLNFKLLFIKLSFSFFNLYP